MPDITRDESMDDLLGRVAEEAGVYEEESVDVPVGEHVRALREANGLTLQELAEKTGFSAALLTQIENRMSSPPLGMLVRFANVFETSVSTLIGGKEEREFSIVRRDERQVTSRVGMKEGIRSAYSYEALGSGKAGRRMEPFLVHLSPKDGSHVVKSVHEGEEFLYVLSGTVEVMLGNLSDILQEGDCIYYNSTTPHHVHSADGYKALILAVLFQG